MMRFIQRDNYNKLGTGRNIYHRKNNCQRSDTVTKYNNGNVAEPENYSSYPFDLIAYLKDIFKKRFV